MKWQILGIGTLISLQAFTANAQTIATDSKGKDVFNFRKTGQLSLPLNYADKSMKLSYEAPAPWRRLGTQYYVEHPKTDSVFKAGGRALDSTRSLNHLTKNPTDTTNWLSTDSAFLTIAEGTSIAISGTLNDFPSNIFDAGKADLGYTLDLGVGWNIDAFNNMANISSVDGNIGLLHTFYAGVYYSHQRTNIIDTVRQTSSKKPLGKIGAKGEASIFFRPTSRLFWGATVISSIEYGKSAEDLDDYQLLDSTLVTGKVINSKDLGKIEYPAKLTTWRTSIAFPIMPAAVPFWYGTTTLQFTCVPYYVFERQFSDKSIHKIGAYINMAEGENIFEKNSAIVAGFGVGSDYTLNDGTFRLFISGSFNLARMLRYKDRKSALKQKS
ncbi:hypothetical protein ACE38W_01855 [Chitinophaga sp. Hz27]|uniref:hypothetical protein n=1 Tax=Chitinophaga sp. Hz27 TaxID=3347169 RepID=UPI0035D72AC3